MTNAIALGQQAIASEIEALQAMSARMDARFQQAIDSIMNCTGRVIVVGMGKSGIIGKKIAATFASTGTPSFFVHPGEAFHGDLGMIKPIDLVLLISNSGETEEVIRLLPFLQHQKNKVIAMTGGLRSTLAKHADVVLDVFVEREACSNNLAPTSSTTAMLVMGDALAVTLSIKRNFRPEDYAVYHPGGSLGRRLLTRVADVMHKTNLPTCAPDDSFRDVIRAINRGRLGLALVMHGDELQGLITDGDMRRAFDSAPEVKDLRAEDMMTRRPKVVAPDVLFSVAEAEMRASKINALVVVDDKGVTVGVLQIYDLEEDGNSL